MKKKLPGTKKEILKKFKNSTEIIIVNDGSTDKTSETINKLKKKYSNLNGIDLRKNQGKSAALLTAFQHAQGDILITSDADLQDEPQDIPKLIDKINQGWDVVSGWRTTRNDQLKRKISTRLFNLIVTKSTGIKLHDFNCGLKAYKKEVINSLNLTGGMHRFMPVLASWQGFKVTEVPVNNRARRFGQPKYGLERMLKGILDLSTIIFLHKYAQRPLRFFGTIGFILFGFGFITGTYLTILRFQGEKIGDRPLLILTVLLIVLGVQFFSLCLIGEMLASPKYHEGGLASNKKQPVPIAKKI